MFTDRSTIMTVSRLQCQVVTLSIRDHLQTYSFRFSLFKPFLRPNFRIEHIFDIYIFPEPSV